MKQGLILDNEVSPFGHTSLSDYEVSYGEYSKLEGGFNVSMKGCLTLSPKRVQRGSREMKSLIPLNLQGEHYS